MMSSLLFIVLFALIYMCANFAILLMYMYGDPGVPPTYDDYLIMLFLGLPLYAVAYIIGGCDWIHKKICTWKRRKDRKIEH